MKGLKLNKLAIVFALGAFVALSCNGGILLYVLHLHARTLVEQQNRQKSLQISSDIQQETAALSRMVRAYTTSAKNKYLTYYYDIIDIRQGKKAAPDGYGPTYWAEVMAGSRVHTMPSNNHGTSLLERMQAEGFSDEEFVAMGKIVACSDTLFEQDQIAFAATQGLYDPVKKVFTDEGKPERGFANDFVYSDNYLRLENALLQEVVAFARLTDVRTQSTVQRVSSRLNASIYTAIAILSATLLAVLFAMALIINKVLTPMKSLTEKALLLGDGDYGIRANTNQGVLELQALGKTFNTMAANIEEDISQREKIRKELEIASARAEESTRAKSIFLANMSHEIRTPMNAIIGMTYLALNTSLTPRQQDYLDKIQTAAQSLLVIINDILDFSKIEAGKLELEKITFRIEDLISNILVLLRQSALDRGIELLFDIKSGRLIGSAGTFLGDPLRLEQIFTNLLSNAVKFTNKGHVKLSIEEQGHAVQFCKLKICVEDTGIGMPPELVGRLFEEFSQADGSTTRRHGGTGLGLAIAKRLLDLMGGSISVLSEPNRGTLFTCEITLPTVGREGAEQDEPKAIGHGLKALVVDDHAAARTVLCTLLGHFGIESTEADSGEAALQSLTQTAAKFDFLFVDWVMPGMGGEELIARVLHMPTSAQTKIVVVSAYDLEKIHELCEKEKVCLFLPKPVLPKDVRQLFEGTGHADNAPAAVLTDATVPHFQGMRVLLVEDNLFNQEVASEMLAYHGIQIDIANNGQEALDILAAKSEDYFHAVLMDIQMPIMDGYEATRRLRAQTRYAKLPIIAMTAHAMIEEQELCASAGMNAHVAKPFKIEDLLQTLSLHFSTPNTALPLAQLTAAKDGETASELPCLPDSIPGIDLEMGLNLCAGRMDVYQHILKGYAQEYCQLADTLRQHLANGQWEELILLAHNFKSASGTIGANELSALGERMEQGGITRSQELPSLVAEMEKQLASTVHAVQQYFVH